MAIDDRYEVQAPMGEGGFAKVFRGEERATGRQVALKVLKSNFYDNAEVRERFQREVFAVASLSNPHIVGMYDFGLNDSDVFIAMEYVAGSTLRERMHECLSIEARFAIVAQIGDAITAAHDRNVVHRDLKPENIKVVDLPDGSLIVKVLDFGMAKLTELESRLQLAPLTRAGICFGTPHYMSPEQIRGKLDDPSIDLYALTTIAYELLTGARPWDGEDPYEVMRAVLRQPAPPVERISGVEQQSPAQIKALNAFFFRAFDKQREARPANAKALVDELSRALFGDSAPAYETAAQAERPHRSDDTVSFVASGLRGDASVEVDTSTAQSASDTAPHGATAIAIVATLEGAAESAPRDAGFVSDATLESTIEVHPDLLYNPRIDPMVKAEGARAAAAFSASRRSERSFRGLLVPLLVLAALGGSVGYLLAGSASAQSSEIHDFIVGGGRAH